MTCNPLDPGSCIARAISSGVDSLAKSFADGASWAVKTMTTAWLGVPSPDLSSSPTATVGWLQDRLSYFVLVAMFCSILYSAYRMSTTGTFDHAVDLGHALGRLVLVAGCAGVATTIGLQVGDAFSHWILTESHVTFSGLVVFTAVTSPAVLMLLAVVVILAQVVQLFIMLIKNAMVVALVAFLPLTAAATNTPAGKQGYQKAVTWLAAFVLYKPVAATIYVISFRLSAADHTLADQMSGIALMVLAILALPALMRFLVPAAASATGGNAGALAGAVVGASLATGAVIATGGAFAGAGGFAAASGPTGAVGGASGAAGGASGVSGALNAAASGATVGSAAGKSGDSTVGTP